MTKKPSATSESGDKPKKRLPQLQRTSKDSLPSFRLTERDMAIIEAVASYRALTTEHIETLFFSPSTRSKCKLRLKYLYHHGFLLRTEQPQSISEGRKPFVYWLDRGGAEQIAINQGVEFSEVEWKPNAHKIGPQFLYHLLDTNTVRIAITQAATKHAFTLLEWRDEETLRTDHANDIVTIKGQQGGEQKTIVVPDDYFMLDVPVPGENRSLVSRFFVEIDRRTVTGEAKASALSQRDWAHKVQAYIAYYRSEAHIKRYGSTAGRVITITTGERRAANLKAITERVGGKARFWFTTFDQIAPETVLTEPIWSVASREGLYTLTKE